MRSNRSATSLLAQACAATRRRGSSVTAGLPAPGRMFSVPMVRLVAEERTVKGFYMGTAIPRRDIPRQVVQYRRGKLPGDRLLSHRLTPARSTQASIACGWAR